MSVKSAINQITCIIESLLCRQRQAWTRARRVNRSGGALTAPGGRGDAKRRIVFCWCRSRVISEHRATSNADAIPNHLLTSLKYYKAAPEIRPIRTRITRKNGISLRKTIVLFLISFCEILCLVYVPEEIFVTKKTQNISEWQKMISYYKDKFKQK